MSLSISTVPCSDIFKNLFAQTNSPHSCTTQNEKNRSLDTTQVPCSRLFHPTVDDTNYEDIENSHPTDIPSEDEEPLPDDYGSDVTEDSSEPDQNEDAHIRHQVPTGYASLGPPTECCNKCHAIMWKEERVNKNVTKGIPKFSTCCGQGTIKLPPTPPTPDYLMHLYTDKNKSKHFKQNIRLYNAMFSFTSTGGKVDYSINRGRAPYVYRLNGQNHHVFGTLIPDDGKDPKFCQLYIYDTEHEVQNRMKWVRVDDGEPVNSEIVEGLIRMLDETNQLVRKFRQARDRFKEQPIRNLRIKMKVCRSESGRENNIGPSDEVAAVLVGDINTTVGERDIIIEKTHIDPNVKVYERICSVHPSLMALQYPLLFPMGEDGYHDEIPYVDPDNQNKKKRKRITMKEYYSYKLQVRKNEGLTVRLGGRLFQQYVVDAFSTVEQARLWWLRTHQKILRSDLYTNISKKLQKGNTDTANVGKGFILPANFLGSRRYMQQNFQDALAVCRVIGHPDIFLTMTCNALWDEILEMMKHLPGCSPQNSPDIIARVFHQKLQQIVDDIKKKNYFGTCLGVEFQKRGLPHVHMLIWLNSDSKKNLSTNVDNYVSAEIPDPLKDPEGFNAVSKFMIHGPCGLQNPKCACMKNFKCTKHFPKKYNASTIFDQSGFPIYKRRNTGINVKKGQFYLDNRWVVPYNRDLLVKYQCHMNVEICCHARSLKYLFKYCLKGHDRATVEISSENGNATVGADQPVDEINAYFDGRYICACEAAYRIFGYPIHYRSISVHRLSFHLPGERTCTFTENDTLEKVARRNRHKRSQLEAFFLLNQTDPSARKYDMDNEEERKSNWEIAIYTS
ncbi:uncharacterized protein LOC108197869 [Daucus carota subsp. sativus]|uniref:uncharacterized protein LOC108197869 n=1 Tax=Daucus carota subsp. sativus TaxID=79200 RepID=UPI003083BE36